MEFLLECIGFPPEVDVDSLVTLARQRGERAPFRGPEGEHLRLALGGGLEVRADRDSDTDPWSVHPYFQSERRLRVAVETVRRAADSRYDALLVGWANPPLEGHPGIHAEAYPLSAVVTDARRLPRSLARGHVLALSLAGFALDVERVGERESCVARRGPARRFADGGWVQPLGGPEDPGGCVELALCVERIEERSNPLTGARVALLETRAPERSLTLFASPWQLEVDQLRAPRAGDWIRGVFLLTGRITGGLRPAVEATGLRFG